MSIKWKIDEGNLGIFHVSGELGKEEYLSAQKEAEATIQELGSIRILIILEKFSGWERSEGWEDLSFAERNIDYASPDDHRPPYSRRVESVFVELPFQIRYKSAPYNDMRLFIIAGIKYSFDVASDSRTRQADGLVKIAPTDFAFEYGAGIQFFFPYFIFSPEFKVSHGLSNILIYNDDLEESNVIEKIISRAFTISLHFEG